MNARIIIIFLLCVNLALYVGGFELVQINGTPFIERFVQFEDCDDSDPGVVCEPVDINDDIESALPDQEKGAISRAFEWVGNVLDPVLMIMQLFALLINVILAPIAIFTINGMPIVAKLFLGVPITVMYYLSLAWFIRGGDG